jgi:hypothetical protein
VNVERVCTASKGHRHDEGLITIHHADVRNKRGVQDRLQISQIVRSKFR